MVTKKPEAQAFRLFLSKDSQLGSLRPFVIIGRILLLDSLPVFEEKLLQGIIGVLSEHALTRSIQTWQ
jgi:hypothetical protein